MQVKLVCTIRVTLTVSQPLPVRADQRTFSAPVGMSQIRWLREASFTVLGKATQDMYFQQLDRSQTSNTFNDFSKTQLENSLLLTQSSIALLV